MSIKNHYSTEVIPLICLDVDGTLVGETGEVTNAVWEACAEATARGQHLALCTARGAFAASWDMAVRLDPNGWHVFHAGGAAVHAHTHEVRSHAIDESVVAAAELIAKRNRWVIEFYTASDYTVDSSDPLAIAHASLIGAQFESRPRSALNTSEGGIVRVQFVVPAADVPNVHMQTANLDLTVTSATSPIMHAAAFVSATCAGITKASGIEMIASELGISMADVMMVGDGLNDLPALAAVGHPVAMGNAAPEVLDLVDRIVAPVVDDGVVDALDLSARL